MGSCCTCEGPQVAFPHPHHHHQQQHSGSNNNHRNGNMTPQHMYDVVPPAVVVTQMSPMGGVRPASTVGALKAEELRVRSPQARVPAASLISTDSSGSSATFNTSEQLRRYADLAETNARLQQQQQIHTPAEALSHQPPAGVESKSSLVDPWRSLKSQSSADVQQQFALSPVAGDFPFPLAEEVVLLCHDTQHQQLMEGNAHTQKNQ